MVGAVGGCKVGGSQKKKKKIGCHKHAALRSEEAARIMGSFKIRQSGRREGASVHSCIRLGEG